MQILNLRSLAGVLPPGRPGALGPPSCRPEALGRFRGSHRIFLIFFIFLIFVFASTKKSRPGLFGRCLVRFVIETKRGFTY